MRVAIVDDEREMRQMLTDYIKRFSEESGIEMEFTEFDHGAFFCRIIECGTIFVIFDIEMPGLNGMETAKKIREIDTGVTIIFVTNMAQYAIEGYAVDAVDYIVKPISYYDFPMKFHRTVARRSSSGNMWCALRLRKGLGRSESPRSFISKCFLITCIFIQQSGNIRSGETWQTLKKTCRNIILYAFTAHTL